MNQNILIIHLILGKKIMIDENVMSWNPWLKKLTNSMVNKAFKFIQHHCIEYHGNNTWNVKPIPTYNSSTYIVTNKKSNFECNCQGFQTKLKKSDQEPYCSHIIAIKIFEGNRQRQKKIERDMARDGVGLE